MLTKHLSFRLNDIGVYLERSSRIGRDSSTYEADASPAMLTALNCFWILRRQASSLSAYRLRGSGCVVAIVTFPVLAPAGIPNASVKCHGSRTTRAGLWGVWAGRLGLAPLCVGCILGAPNRFERLTAAL
jgi:hypothetical protein